MRILITSPSYPPFNSGLGNAVAQQAISLIRAGHEVVVATGGTERQSWIDVNGVRIELFPVSGANSWIEPIRGDRCAYVNFLRGSSWDVLILNAWQNWATDLALEHIHELSGRKFLYSHCISTNVFFSNQPIRSVARYIAWRPYWRRLPRIMRQLDGMLFLAGRGSDSRFDDLELARKWGVPLHVIPNSLSPAALVALISPPRSLSERDRLIAVGSYHWQKGFDFVIQAYAASGLRNRVPLHLFGQKHTSYSTVLESLARDLRLDKKFLILHDGVSGENLITEYGRSRLVLSGSYTECQPLALIDASATGTPFIARATGCIVNMPGGQTVSNWREMALNIDALASDQTRWQVLSESARSAASCIYHPDVVARKLMFAVKV